MRDHKEDSGWGSEEGRSDLSSFTEGLRERILRFGWFEELHDGVVRFVTDHSGSVPLYYAQDQGHAKALARRILKRSGAPDKELLQLHMLRNEAYYFAARHALEVRKREKYGVIGE